MYIFVFIKRVEVTLNNVQAKKVILNDRYALSVINSSYSGFVLTVWC